MHNALSTLPVRGPDSIFERYLDTPVALILSRLELVAGRRELPFECQVLLFAQRRDVPRENENILGRADTAAPLRGALRPLRNFPYRPEPPDGAV